MPLGQLFSSHRKLTERAEELQREAEELRLQLRGLENERNGLQHQVRRLEKESLEFKQQEGRQKEDALQSISLKFERDEFRVLYDKTEAEKAALEKELIEFRSEAEMRRERLWTPPGHFSSPITDPNDPLVRQTEILNVNALNNRADLVLDEPEQLRLLGWLGEHGSRFPFQSGPIPGWRYHVGNGHFGHADAALMFSMLLEYKPSRLIEVGGGFSSLLVMDVNDHFLDHSLEASFFDPHADAILSLLTPLDNYRARVQAKQSRDVSGQEFAQLGRGDILSLETSHVAKTGSDVCDLLFRVLPALEPGVLVHVHDIYFPFEYPESWVVQDNRSWNEAYILRAFLQFNSAFRVLFFNSLMAAKYPGQMVAAFPGLEDMQASSIWLEKLG